MATELQQPVVASGVRVTHFFNGRVLTAEDLRREQDAARDRHRGLAGAIGEGVVRGMEVTVEARGLPSPTLSISAGLAFNRDGDPVALPQKVKLRLIPTAVQAAEEAGRFAACARPEGVAEITNPGFYLLAARPASAHSRERVAAVDLDSGGVGTACGSRYEELGASFHLVPLPLPAGGDDQPLAKTLTGILQLVTADVELVRAKTATDAVRLRLAKNLSRLRNGMAYWCAGYDVPGERVAALAVSASAAAPALAPLDTLRASGALASCEVPLALLYVSRDQLEWVDEWAVRRPPVLRVGPDPLPLVRGTLAGADGAAALLQFRRQAAALLDTAAPTVKASDWFLFLPPAAVLPMKAATAAGFDRSVFFAGRTAHGPRPLPAARVPALLREALADPPIDLATAAPCWLYAITDLRPAGAQPYLLFAGRELVPEPPAESAAPAVRIDSVLPSGPVRVGDQVRVTGANFEASIGGHRVHLDATRVLVFATATNSELAFDVPELPDLSEEGRSVSLVVSNRETSAMRTLFVRPRLEPLQGNVDVEYAGAEPDTPMPGEDALFAFTLRNRSNKAVEVTLSPVVSVTAWQGLVVVLSTKTSSTPITTVSLELEQERQVFVRIPLPEGSQGTPFTLRLDAVAGGTLSSSSGPQPFTVGTPAEQPDPGITSLALTYTNPDSALQGGVVHVPPTGALVRAGFNVGIAVAGSYVVSAFTIDDGGNQVPLQGWNVGIVGQQADRLGERTYTITEAEVAGGGTSRTPEVALTATSNAALEGVVRVRVQREGEDRKREVRLNVARQ